MKKALLLIGVILLALLIVVFVAGRFFLGSIVKEGVNRIGPRVTGAPVTLDNAQVAPFSGSGTLTGLTISNPPGWSDRPAFQLGEVKVDVEPASLFGDHIVVNDVTIEDPTINYETRLVTDNIRDLIRNIEKAVGQGQRQQTTKDGRPVRIEIKHFALRGGKVMLAAGGNGTTLTMAPVELNDLGTAEGGVPPDRMAVLILQGVAPSIASAAAQGVDKLGGAIGGSAGEKIRQAGDLLRGLLGPKSGTSTQPATDDPKEESKNP